MTELHVLSVGASTPLGLDARQTAFMLRACKGEPRSSPFRGLDGNTLGTMRCHRMDDKVVGYPRYLELAVPALREALDGGSAETARGEPIVLLLSAPNAFEGENERISSHLLTDLAKAANVELDPRSAMVRLGHAGFAALLGRVSMFSGDLRVVVGGVDSYHDPARLRALDEGFRIQSNRSEYGFVPSEGAAFACVRVAAKKQTSAPLATIKFVATAEEPEGDLVHAKALTELLRDPRMPSEVPWVVWDLNHDEQRYREWVFATGRNRHVKTAPAQGTVDQLHRDLGDVGAATGALYLAWVTMALRYGFAQHDAALIVTSSDGPERGIFYVEGESS